MESRQSVEDVIAELRSTADPNDPNVPDHVKAIIWGSGQASQSRLQPSLPPIQHQVAGAIRTGYQVVKGVVRDLASGLAPGLFVDDEEYERRVAICRACDHLRVPDERCGSPDAKANWGCGCYISDHGKMPGKAHFRDAHCPLTEPKW